MFPCRILIPDGEGGLKLKKVVDRSVYDELFYKRHKVTENDLDVILGGKDIDDIIDDIEECPVDGDDNLFDNYGDVL